MSGGASGSSRSGHRRHGAEFQPIGLSEIQPAASSSTVDYTASPSWSGREPRVPQLVEKLQSFHPEVLHQALSQVILLTKQQNESFMGQIVEGGAIPALMEILVREEVDIQLRIRSAAALCNLAQSEVTHRGFVECDAVRALTDDAIGGHQALTGAVALTFKSMLTSEELIRSMVSCCAPTMLFRGMLLCTNLEIVDTITDVLIQFTTVDVLKEHMIESRLIESCVYYLHVLARSHYHTSLRQTTGFSSDQEEHGAPSFTYKSMRDALVWSLMQIDGVRSPPRWLPMTPMSAMRFIRGRDWEGLLKTTSVTGIDHAEMDFTDIDMERGGLCMELLTWLVYENPIGCGRLANMQFSLDVLAYWIRCGNCSLKQGGLLATCCLLRTGHRGYVTLKDIVRAIGSILQRSEAVGYGMTLCKFKCVAAEAVNDLSEFGGENIRIAISAAGILHPLLKCCESDDFRLQHLTLRALHSVCSHPVALAHLVDGGAIPFLCRFLAIGLKDAAQRTGIQRSSSCSRAARGCLSRKRVATISMSQAEIDVTQRRQQDYSRIRRLEYGIALVRCIAAVQSADWLHDFGKCRIVPITLDALSQNYSMVMRKQALGILASIITLRDHNISTNICLDRGCDLLLNLRAHVERLGDVDSAFWLAWINFVLYCLAQNNKTRRFVEQAMKQQYGDDVDLRDNSIHQLLKPDQTHLDLEWVASTI